MRKIIGLVIVAAAVGGAYVYLSGQASDRLQAQALAAVDLMDMSEGERNEVRGYMESSHQAAYDAALAANKDVGGQFDIDVYKDKLWAGMEELARADGQNDLVEKLAHEKEVIEIRADY